MLSALGATCLSDNAILSLIRGTMDGSAASLAQSHVDECFVCQELLAQVISGVSGVSGPREITRDIFANGTVVGRYTVREPIGAGAMGIVYLADDRDLNRKVALKVLRSKDADASARLSREAQALARIAHPNVIVVYEVGTFEGHLYMAMEFVEGGNLTTWLAAKRSPNEILDAFVQAGRGLAVAHAAGLVHRDFKPDNVLVGRDGRVRVVDFGLAREDLFTEDAREMGESKSVLHTLTRTGAFVGTPAYMAPEQYAGLPADARTDQFSFCVALYEAVHGKRPFDGANVEELSRAVMGGYVRPGREAQGFGSVDRVLGRGLAGRREERFSSMDDLLVALARHDASWVARARVPATLAGFTVAALALGAGVYWWIATPSAPVAASAPSSAIGPDSEALSTNAAAHDASGSPSSTATRLAPRTSPSVSAPPSRPLSSGAPPRRTAAPTGLAPEQGGVIDKPPF